ncbi:MAG: response regulator [Alphaproteobacteria bacterium CG_4_9_14_3_um_filter_47_13]|nr:MAG: response regulator [Alphaproteobacteria bacterium CG_4_9_14_3_um_filter_47_13]
MEQNTQEPKQERAYDLGRFRILIVEDSAFIGSLMCSALREMGVGKALTAKGVTEAKEKIATLNDNPSPDNIDVVILDWLMPDGRGSDLLSWIRSQKSETIKFLPTIICSAYASEELVEESRGRGANEILVKPVSAEKLAKRILYVIDRPRPFIASKVFFGPDRRRKIKDYEGQNKRTTKPHEIEQEYEQL